MGYNKLTNKYEPSLWISPADGSLLDAGEIYLSYNYVIHEFLNSGLRKKKSDFKNFLARYDYGYPSSLTPNSDTYYNLIEAADGTMSLFLNNRELVLNTHYTYSYKYNKFTLINLDTTEKNIGLLSCKYRPKDKKYLFGDVNIDPLIGNTVKIKKIPSIYIFETINSIRYSLENIWHFLKKEKPLWVGGINNQQSSSNNLIKFITPVIDIHILEILDEIKKLNEYINFKYSSSFIFNNQISVNENSFLDGVLLKNIMEIIYNMEKKLDELLVEFPGDFNLG